MCCNLTFVVEALKLICKVKAMADFNDKNTKRKKVYSLAIGFY